MKKMIKIAITGNIASGKSTVEKIIESNGYKVYDTDKIAHDILANSKEVIEIFGTNNRKEIAKIVFSDKNMLQKLEALIHPKVKKEIENIFSSELDIVFISVPQLFETGFDNLFDKIIYVTADKNIREERLMKRNNFTKEDAEKRINAQNETNKKEKSDFVINNNSSLENLENQVSEAISILLR